METLRIEALIEVFEHSSELTPAEQSLLERAEQAMHRAYAPYSQFRVGAAILLANEHVIEGNNQENGAYPSGLCAERVAMFMASASFPGIPVQAIAITASSSIISVDHPISPCGACRQVLLEYQLNQENPIVLLLKGATGKTYRLRGLTQLLPLFFNEEGLKKH
jgi:cytidine deaminase